MMVRIQNKNLKNSLIVTQFGQFNFDAQGRATVPEELARELVTLQGFTLIDDAGNPISFPDANRITLESGVVWESIPGGYVATDGDKSYTVSGSAVNIGVTNIVPTNILVKNGTISLASGIDVVNLHVLGVANNDTIYVGDIVYQWEDADNNPENGLELVKYIPPKPIVTLDSGVVFESISGGYVAEEGNQKFTISGSAVQVADDGIVPTNVTVQGGKVYLADDIDTANLHVSGVTENDTVTVGDKTYVWTDTDNNLTNGLELVEYIPTRVTLPSGVVAESIEGGHTLEDSSAKVTMSGSAIKLDNTGVIPTNVTLSGGKLSFDPNIDINNLHVAGVNSGDTIAVGDKTYVWADLTSDHINGLELKEYIPTKVTLDSGVVWESISGGYVGTDNGTQLTISGSAIQLADNGIVPTNVTLSSGTIQLAENIDLTNFHVLGVSADSTVVIIGNKTYVWKDADNNPVNGLELVEYIPPEPKITLPSGVVAESIAGGYSLSDSSSAYTVSGSAVQLDSNGIVPTNITLQGGKLSFDSDIDVANIHVSGVTENDKVTIGDKTYVWADLDNDTSNGLELKEYEPKVTLPSGVVAESIAGGYTLSDSSTAVTISGTAVQVADDGVTPTNITLQGGTVKLADDIDTDNLHIAGVTEGDSVTVGDKVYIWTDLDNNTENGLELKEYEPKVTLDSGVVWESISGGYVAVDGAKSYTVSGSAIQLADNQIVPTNVTVSNGAIQFSADIDTANLHVAGVTENDTISVGNKNYIWTELDNLANGLELKEYITQVTLESGVEVESLPGGYSLSDSLTAVTISGSAVNVDGIVPTNVTLDNGVLTLDPTIDTANLHVIGVNAGDTIAVGDKNYMWKNLDNDISNGLELEEYITRVTLPSGVVAESISSGYVLSDDTTAYTLAGSAVHIAEDKVTPVNVTLTGGELSFDPEIDKANLHVVGVNAGDTITVGDKTYIWADLASDYINGLELKEYITNITLPSGVSVESIAGGYVMSDTLNNSYTISGSAIHTAEDGVTPTNIILQGGKVQLADNIDTDNLHVAGIAEGDTIAVGGKNYIWTDLDNNTENGLELKEWITKATLDGGVSWESLPSGYIVSDSDHSYTLTGTSLIFSDPAVVPTNVTLSGGKLSFDPEIDTDNLHVLGAPENETIAVGDTNYIWTDLDGNVKNGLELKKWITKTTLESGVTVESIAGGYVLADNSSAYTVSGSAVQPLEDSIIPTNVSLVSGSLVFDPGIDTDNLHVAGANAGDTLSVDDKNYIWADLDNNIDTLELKEYITKVTLPSGVVAESIPGGYTLTDNIITVTISGSAVQIAENEVTPTNISLQGGKIQLAADIDTANLHVAGVTENETIAVGDKNYIWRNLDENSDTLELKEWVTKTTLDSGVVVESLPSGYSLSDSIGSYTISGSAVNVEPDTVVPTNVTLQGGQLSFDPDIDVANIHVSGVTAGDTLPIKDKNYIWTDLDSDTSNGLELKEYITQVTLPSGVVAESLPSGYSLSDSSTAVTISGTAVQVANDNVTPVNVVLDNGTISLAADIDTTNLHVLGASENETIAVGDKNYIWTDLDNNTENGLELKEWITKTTLPSGVVAESLSSGYSLSDNSSAYTVSGSAVQIAEDNITPTNITLQNGKLVFDSDIDTANLHVTGVTANETLTIGDKNYIWKNLDENSDTLELKEYITKTTLDSGVVAESTPGGYVLSDSLSAYTISGSAIQVDEVIPTNITLQGGKLSLADDIDTANLHVAGVVENDTVAVGDKVYVWNNTDNNIGNGLELVEYIDPKSTIPSFSYDFDDVTFTLTGGLAESVDANVLNEHSSISSNGLSFDNEVITNADDVHIQGLTPGTKVTVEGKTYELRDTDNNLENGYELDEPEEMWVKLNQWTPYVWKHYIQSIEHLTVIGSDVQPEIVENELTVTGNDLRCIQNLSSDTIVINGSIQGILTSNVSWDVVEGLKGGIRTPSFILMGTTMYLPKVKLTGVLSKLDYTFEGGVLTIHAGQLDLANVQVFGKALTTVIYKNKTYYVNISLGKLVPNAWQRG